MRIKAVTIVSVRNADHLHEVQCFLARGLGRQPPMQPHGLGNLLADAHHRIEAAGRILKDHGNALATDVFQPPRAGIGDVLAVKQYRARDGGAVGKKPEHGQPAYGLAAAAFADDAEGFAASDIEIDTMNDLCARKCDPEIA